MTDPTPPAGDAPLPEDAPPEATQLPAEPTVGNRLDAAVERANLAIDELRAALAEKAAEIGAEVNAKVDEIQAAIDEIQAARQDEEPPVAETPAQAQAQQSQSLLRG